MKFLFIVFTWSSLLCFPLLASSSVGYRHLDLADENTGRPLSVAVLYPTDAAAESESLGENPAFFGVPVIKQAQPQAGLHPFVILSHGYGGNWRNQLWLAHALAQKGYVVTAPNHPGMTSFDMNPVAAAKLWQRPDDVSRVITALQTDSAIAGNISSGQIAVVGHSLGGWTALAVAGARFNAEQFVKDCQTQKQLASCKIYLAIGAGKDETSRARLDASARDQRVSAVVALDLGLARGFTPTSLSAIPVPVLVIAAGVPDPALPASLESRYLMRYLPANKAQYQEIADATHFSFMQLCKPGAAALINASEPGEGIICTDGATGSREAIHRALIEKINGFLMRTWQQN
ncbi:putative dienelactone hydrolase|uniref:Putative dienelactone hydrolase n=1 Tax=Brenneria salicis ATCC 15712 = DSM 30166 TaxID=714314 RepID=A0A366I9H7_9GAMM|nr:alpha/beta fold hydrolase [Brenneria salicis]NMN92577.1 putative dienelactone hydrolase [Brenneria salicis ATCC 15712 = DSM 30166]RBP64596.1 putative dienelactone hydrolase [Brenneria salicis ATCC 15712 = DSM 30166]RLM31384.1 dienelactone hydrolase [Brenneria salicis ATCC 15712 = DSM 30166]